jgi:2-C-methyl-D-erythritol 4-phosphate cytidylyltransferase
MLRAARKDRGVIAALPVTDTLKKETRRGMLGRTVHRTGLWMAQTPQVFRFDLLVKAHQRARRSKRSATDDAALVERMNVAIRIFPGSPGNIKITTRADVRIAEMWISSRNTR